MQIWPGEPYPLGANFDGTGTNFSLFSELAERVELCLFDDQGNETRVDLPEVDGFRWHGYLPHIEPGQRYGFRVYGPWAPEKGQRCNPAKLLLDPYAKAIEGDVDWDEAVFPYWFDNPEGPPNDRDSTRFVPKSVVISPYFDWGNERPPRRPLEETIIYEAHVKGFTVRHPGIPEGLRGTYAGLGHRVHPKRQRQASRLVQARPLSRVAIGNLGPGDPNGGGGRPIASNLHPQARQPALLTATPIVVRTSEGCAGCAGRAPRGRSERPERSQRPRRSSSSPQANGAAGRAVSGDAPPGRAARSRGDVCRVRNPARRAEPSRSRSTRARRAPPRRRRPEPRGRSR